MRVRYYGHIGKTTGYGRAGEHLCRSLLAAGVEIDVQPFRVDDATPHHTFFGERVPALEGMYFQGGEADVVIVHDLPLDAPRQILEGRVLASDAYAIVYTTWEALTVPEAVLEPLIRTFDQIWVPSEVNAKVFRDAAKLYGLDDTTIRVVPHAYDADATVVERKVDLEKPYRFFWYGAWTIRKNPEGVMQAYAYAFDKRDHVQLHMHSIDLTKDHAGHALGVMGQIQDNGTMPPISFSNEVKPLEVLMGDCYVTATRGEAWNLPAFEASVIGGTQVIAPHSMGSDDYLMSSSARLYGSTRAPARVDVKHQSIDGNKVAMTVSGAQGLTVKSLWREPDILQLARAMRDAYEMRERAISFGYNTAARWGYGPVGLIAKNLLSNLIDN